MNIIVLLLVAKNPFFLLSEKVSLLAEELRAIALIQPMMNFPPEKIPDINSRLIPWTPFSSLIYLNPKCALSV